ncbi:hypothetical protein HKBW3S25_01754 [Candidatus Hakubella thermalkaliphila]|uniref:Uncharacterized protein n=1 Tax=Candidatus Hakubella thermalkaliphila TaxID=2754717 RepID=A0A6V8P1W0_9ACTN|nr:hypothetical protein HKBW3S25_01754 [Candidatus Hakubella thermalkaliphila]
MNDRALNPLRLLLAGAIIAYFAAMTWPPPPQAVEATIPLPAPAPGPVATPRHCAGEITQVAIGTYEVRLQITGAGERILVYTDQGNLVVSTYHAGSGGGSTVSVPLARPPQCSLTTARSLT